MNYTNYVHIYIHQNQYTAELLGKKKKKSVFIGVILFCILKLKFQ